MAAQCGLPLWTVYEAAQRAFRSEDVPPAAMTIVSMGSLLGDLQWPTSIVLGVLAVVFMLLRG